MEIEGHRCLMLCRAEILLSELKAFDASVSSSRKLSRTELMAASHPAICPAQSWKEPAASCMSPLVITISALAVMRLAISPMPIGLTPGHLSRAINLLGQKWRNRTWVNKVGAEAFCYICEWLTKRVRGGFEGSTQSTPGMCIKPRGPFILVQWIESGKHRCCQRESGGFVVPRAGWKQWLCRVVFTLQFTVFELGSAESAGCSKCSTPPFPVLANRSRAACVFPLNIRLSKLRAINLAKAS